MVVREGPTWPWEEPLKNRGIRILTAVLLLAGALPLADAAPPKRNCGNLCETTYSTCLRNARDRAARKACRATHKACKRTCI